jgi:hypothetical protein
MKLTQFLAVPPFTGMPVSVPLLNRVEPLIFDPPLILDWVVLTACIMAIVYLTGPAADDVP